MTMINFADWKRDYYAKKQAIMNDDSLTELEKENKVRELAGIEPLTIEQFIAQQNVYLK